jgi:hypothetical protein
MSDIGNMLYSYPSSVGEKEQKSLWTGKIHLPLMLLPWLIYGRCSHMAAAHRSPRYLPHKFRELHYITPRWIG